VVEFAEMARYAPNNKGTWGCHLVLDQADIVVRDLEGRTALGATTNQGNLIVVKASPRHA